MTVTDEGTTYEIEGRLLEVCNCDAICPCWVGEDPDHGTCDAILTYYVDRGSIEGVDVSDRALGFVVHIPGNVLAGQWKAAVFVDDTCTEEQQGALLKLFTGKLGGPIADVAALIGEVVSVERVPIVFTVEEGSGTVQIGDVAEARLTPFQGATGQATTLVDTVFSTVPGAPAYPGKAEFFRRSGAKYGMADVDLQGKNAVQATFRFEG